jgi:hypothetical protein
MKTSMLPLCLSLTVFEVVSQVPRPTPPVMVPRIAPTAIYEIAATTPTGAVAFERAGGAALLVGGGLVVADRGNNLLVRFDARGARVGASGGSGQGPGEFSLLWTPIICRNALIGVELAGTAVQEFSIDGRHRRTVTLAAGLLAEQPPVCIEGQVAGMTEPRPEAGGAADSPVRTMTAKIAVFDSAGAIARQSPALPAGEYLLQGGGGMPRPLAPQLVFAALPGGEIVFGTGADSTVSVMRRNGTIRSFALPLRRRRPTSADRVAASDAILAMVPAVVHDRIRQMLDAAPIPTSMPFYRGMQSQPDGTLWLDTSAPGDASMEWTVVRNTRIVGTVRLPVRGKVLALTADRIVILREDEDGEQVVGVYAVVR